MNWSECNFENLKDCAKLYELTLPTAKSWIAKSEEKVPWRDPFFVLEWYRKSFGREPRKGFIDRINILQAQMLRCEDVVEENFHPGSSNGVAGDPATKVAYRSLIETKVNQDDLLYRKRFYEEVCSDLANARTLARIASEEREAYDSYKDLKARGLDYSAEVRRWQDLTKVKRDWAKTQDAVDLAFVALREWLRSEWEPQWKQLKTALDGRRLGMDAREDLKLVADDPVEWRRVWDMNMERVILNVLDKENDELK
jgi:hypothetical protein